MIRYPSNGVSLMIIVCLLAAALNHPKDGFGQSGTSNPKKSDANLDKLDLAGRQYLRKASICFHLRPATAECSQQDFLDKAGAVYLKMAEKINEGAPDSRMLLLIANGLLKSGRAYEALRVLERTDTSRDPSLAHLMGDILYSIEDYQNSAQAYRRWISLGCNGYFVDVNDPELWVLKNDLPRCSNLPELMRAKLDYIEERIPDYEPGFGLPEVNIPAIRNSSR